MTPHFFNLKQTEMQEVSAAKGATLRIKRCDMLQADELPSGGVFHCIVPGCGKTVCKMENCARGANHSRCETCDHLTV